MKVLKGSARAAKKPKTSTNVLDEKELSSILWWKEVCYYISYVEVLGASSLVIYVKSCIDVGCISFSFYTSRGCRNVGSRQQSSWFKSSTIPICLVWMLTWKTGGEAFCLYMLLNLFFIYAWLLISYKNKEEKYIFSNELCVFFSIFFFCWQKSWVEDLFCWV